MAVTEALIQEIDTEGKITRRVLERVPERHLSWKPHAKSMSLGQLALHLAQTSGYTEWGLKDAFEFTPEMMASLPEAKTQAEILHTHDECVAKAMKALTEIGDAGLMQMWKATAGGSTIMEMPKIGLVRVVAMNHAYHHRGQLSVYLRLLDVPVPGIYGPSADEGRAN